jgi:hypothetical protein
MNAVGDFDPRSRKLGAMRGRPRTRWLLMVGVVGVAAALPVLADGGPLAVPEARAEDVGELAVGTQLEALSDVKLSRAELARGSRVSITKLIQKQGRLAAVDVELADGYIARVPIATLRAFFRIVSD